MPFSPLEFKTYTGPPVVVGDTRIFPHSRVFRLAIRWPRGGGGLIWNRPIAVTISRADGPEQRLPIIDITRLFQIAILALGVFGAMMIARRESNE